jgi:hypothetical protein
MSLRRSVAFAALALLLPAFAGASYVILTKDGRRLVAKDKYRVQGQNAIYTQVNGVVTSIPMSQVDIAATDKLAKEGVGDAMILDAGKQQQAPGGGQAALGSGNLAEVARQRKLKEEAAKKKEAASGKKPAANVPYPDRDIANSFLAALDSAGFTGADTAQGSDKGILKVTAIADKEDQVFSILTTVAQRYRDLHGSTSTAPMRVELEMKTTSGESAGSFSFTWEEIDPLVAGKISPQEFFVRNVIL